VSKGETLLECDQCGYRESLEGHPPRPSRPPRPQQSPPLQSAPREEHSIRCPHCGEPIKEDFNYCPRCGRKV
jgi:DNA-directed RNA polymerase subunit RPC12/RpoP